MSKKKDEVLHFINQSLMAKTSLMPTVAEEQLLCVQPLSLVVNQNSNMIMAFDSKFQKPSMEIQNSNYVLSANHFLSETNRKNGLTLE